MIIGYITFLALGIVAFLIMARFGLLIRIAVVLAVFLVPSIALTVWIVRVGDKPPSDAITVILKRDYILDNRKTAPYFCPDRPVSSKKPAYLAGLFALFFAFGVNGFGGDVSILRSTSSTDGADCLRCAVMGGV